MPAPQAARTILYLRSYGLGAELIFVTHARWDRVEGLKRIKEEIGTKVVAHAEEVPYVRGDYTAGHGFEPVDVDVPVKDSDEVLGLLAIHTPGHTPVAPAF